MSLNAQGNGARMSDWNQTIESALFILGVVDLPHEMKRKVRIALVISLCKAKLSPDEMELVIALL